MLHGVRGCVPLRFLHRNALFLIIVPLLTLLFFLLNVPHQRYFTENALPPGYRESGVDEPKIKKPVKNFIIHVWRHGERMKRRFLRSYGNLERDPFAHCSVKNCKLTIDDTYAHQSDAIIFHLHQTKGPQELPKNRTQGQIWIFFTDESPHHTFLATKRYSMRDYNGLFNWSMTYRSDSDIPVPYGRTVPRSSSNVEGSSSDASGDRDKGAVILGSNCGGRNHRWDYVHELQKYLEVDIFGGCGPLKCPGHFTRDCKPLSNYRFYLAFENSNCREYITEKFWWNAYHKGSLPVVMGSPKSDYVRLAPPNSFIHTDDFETPRHLAAYLSFLMDNETEFNKYFEWKKDHQVSNEHGYFGSNSMHLCRVCEALNSDLMRRPKAYDDLESFWSVKSDCRDAKWKPT